MTEIWSIIKAFQSGSAKKVTLSEVLVLDSSDSWPAGVYRYDIGKSAFERISVAIAALVPFDAGGIPAVQSCVVKRLGDASLCYVENEGRQRAERRNCLGFEFKNEGELMVSHLAIEQMPVEKFPSTSALDARLVCEMVSIGLSKGLRCKLEIQDFGEHEHRHRVGVEVDDSCTDRDAFVAVMDAIATAVGA